MILGSGEPIRLKLTLCLRQRWCGVEELNCGGRIPVKGSDLLYFAILESPQFGQGHVERSARPAGFPLHDGPHNDPVARVEKLIGSSLKAVPGVEDGGTHSHESVVAVVGPAVG